MKNNNDLVDFAILSMKYRTKLTNKYINRKPYKAVDPLEVNSYIPGTILDIKVKEGQKVKEGETLLLLEAMKMVNEVRMPFNGKVMKIYVRKGQQIPKDFLMIELK